MALSRPWWYYILNPGALIAEPLNDYIEGTRQKKKDTVSGTGATVTAPAASPTPTTAPATTGEVTAPSEMQLAQQSQVLNLTKQAAWQRTSAQAILGTLAKGYTSVGSIVAESARSGIRLEGSPLYQKTVTQTNLNAVVTQAEQEQTMRNAILTQGGNISFGASMLQAYNDLNKIDQSVNDMYLNAFKTGVEIIGMF